MKKTNIDGHRLFYHPKRVTEWMETGDTFPIYVEIGPTNRCNHKCVFCALDWMKHGGNEIDREVLLRTIKDMAEHGVKSIMFAGEGESLLHKDIAEFVAFAKKCGIDVAITSNGAMLKKELAEQILPHLSWIRFSLDAASPETYAKVHGVRAQDFEKTIENIRNAVEIRNKLNLPVVIGIQALIIADNVDELYKIAVLAKEIGVDNVQIKPYSHHPNKVKESTEVASAEADKACFGFVPKKEKVEQLGKMVVGLETENFQVFFREQTMKRMAEGRTYTECHGLPFYALIESTGDVVPCNMFHSDPDYVYGNIYKDPLSVIWKSQRRQDVIKKIKDRGIELCRVGCRLDPVNRYLFSLKNPSDHVNFI